MMRVPVTVVLGRFDEPMRRGLREVLREGSRVRIIPKVSNPAQRTESQGGIR